jgi:hypothetical protein
MTARARLVPVLVALGVAIASLAFALWPRRGPAAAAPATAAPNGVRPMDVDSILARLSSPRDDASPSRSRDAAPAPGTREPVVPGDGRVPNLERVRGLRGERVSGRWPNGERMFEARQRRFDGQWKLDGRWESWHANGEIEELGGYRAGREHGDWQWWYASGMPLAEGRFEDGSRTGRWTFWHENAQKMAEGAYVGGLPEGRWTFWFEDGRVYAGASGEYRAGALAPE